MGPVGFACEGEKSRPRRQSGEERNRVRFMFRRHNCNARADSRVPHVALRTAVLFYDKINGDDNRDPDDSVIILDEQLYEKF